MAVSFLNVTVSLDL